MEKVLSPEVALHVAIIEADARLGRMLERQLARRGYQPSLLADPERYVEELMALAPDFALLELNLGLRDGFEILHKLARNQCQTQIIVTCSEPRLLTVACDMGARLGLRMAGALAKPISEELLLAHLDAARAHVNRHAPLHHGLSAQDVLTGLANYEFTVHYQPAFELPHRRLIGMEALLRWHHPVFGILSAEHFAHLIKDSPVAEPVSWFVLETAINDLATFNRRLTEQLFVSVNLPAVVVAQERLVHHVTRLLQTHRVPPGQLVVELETGATEISASIQKTLSQLSLCGIQIAMDDAGSGLSSLECLAALPFTILKLDKSFIQQLPSHMEHKVVAEEILRLARKLNLRIVAEGIENGVICNMLTAMGCEQGQGYLLGRPMMSAEFTTWATQRDITTWQPALH